MDQVDVRNACIVCSTAFAAKTQLFRAVPGSITAFALCVPLPSRLKTLPFLAVLRYRLDPKTAGFDSAITLPRLMDVDADGAPTWEVPGDAVASLRIGPPVVKRKLELLPGVAAPTGPPWCNRLVCRVCRTVPDDCVLCVLVCLRAVWLDRI